MALANQGFMTMEELRANNQYPSEERMAEGPIAIAECIQNIPCNPCEAACKFGAIKIGKPITNLPCVDPEKCIGCTMCIAQCSGLAIFVIDKTYSETQGTIAMPYEYWPTPEVGDKVVGVTRSGDPVCDAEVIKVQNPASFDRTPVVTIAVPKESVDEVRSIKRKDKEIFAELDGFDPDALADDELVCRCEEVSVGEIKAAIRDGARDVTGVKRRTRAGMGLCQGRTCEKMVQAIIRAELGSAPEEISKNTSRPPVRPITFGSIAGGEGNE